MKKIDAYLEGQSPLPLDWRNDLLVPVETMEELNEQEFTNIEEAVEKYFKIGATRWHLFDPWYLKEIHKSMFENVWTWAGKFRLPGQQTNIGVSAEQIQEELKKACDDCSYWIENNTYELSECAVRYHHRLVLVHPFPNGNGRFARFIANFLMLQNGERSLNWGGKGLSSVDESRKKYLNAIYKANEGDYSELVAFAVSKTKI